METNNVTDIKSIRPEERRMNPRVEYALPLQYKSSRNVLEEARLSLTKNISAGGISFKTAKFVSLGHRLIVEIRLPGSDTPLRIISKLVWIKRERPEAEYDVGYQFVDMSEPDNNRLKKFIDSNRSN